MFSKILKLLGLSGSSTNNADRKAQEELDKQITKSIEDYKNRPVHVQLTEQVIDDTPDDGLLQVVFDNLCEKQKDYEREYEDVQSWNPSRRAIYIIWMLEAEVNNGGFNQYYFNPTGQYHKQVPEALSLVGADQFADLMKRANDMYEKENEIITKHQDGTLEGFSKSYVDNPLEAFDSEFYKLDEGGKLAAIQVDYIRRHKKEFVDQ